MTQIHIVNEFSVWSMARNFVLGNAVYVYKTGAMINPLTPLLQNIVNLMMKTGRVKKVQDIEPENNWIVELPLNVRYADHFSQTHDQIERHFNIAARYPADNDYIHPPLKMLDSYQSQLIGLVQLTDWLDRIFPARFWSVNGLNVRYLIIHRMVHGSEPNFNYRLKPRRVPTANYFNIMFFSFIQWFGWLGKLDGASIRELF